MTINIKTGGAAFHADGDPKANKYMDNIIMASELRKIFAKICTDIEQEGKHEGIIMDTNGNNVGSWNID